MRAFQFLIFSISANCHRSRVLVRIFIIFHDCCHYSFFKSRQHNKILGTITGVLTMFPYSQWGHSHAIHHATSSNLDKRGTGDIWVLTVTEYKEASIWKKSLTVSIATRSLCSAWDLYMYF